MEYRSDPGDSPPTRLIMFGRLFAALTLVTLAELALLIPLGRAIGFGWTFVLVLLTAVIGAQLLKREGVRALQRFNTDLASGRPPSDAILDGLCVLVAGAFLLTPGLLTDLFGFALLIPVARVPLKRVISARVKRAVDAGKVHVATGFDPFAAAGARAWSRGRTIDVTSRPAQSERAEAAHSTSAGARRNTEAARQVYVDGDVIDVRPGQS